MSKDVSPAIEAAAQNSEIATRMLVTISLDDAAIRLVANTDEPVTFEGNEYTPARIERGTIQTAADGKVEDVELTLSNKWLQWAQYMATHINGFNGRRCLIQEVFIDHLEEGAVWQFEGRMSGPRMTVSEFKVKVIRDVVDFQAESPNATYDPMCQYRMFKDDRCRYVGPETDCDGTLSRCIDLGNVTRFGGHPSVPREMVIK